MIALDKLDLTVFERERVRYQLADTNPPPFALGNGWIKNLVLHEVNRVDLLDFASWDKQFSLLPAVNRELDWKNGGRLEAVWMSDIPSGNAISICAWAVEKGRYCPLIELSGDNTASLGNYVEWTGSSIEIAPQSILFAIITGGTEVVEPVYLALMGGSY